MRGNLFDSKDYEAALSERLPKVVTAIRAAQQNRANTQRSAVIVFVTRRAHAEDIAERLAESSACDVEAFHSGLDAGTREDIYTRFREGDLDVLVATKAFGMGMDIPDIHWVVHISPPAYLEDYLQEVGRIGRGEKERARAGFGEGDRLSAMMLFSDSDFENMRSLRAKNELQAPQIVDIEQKLVKNIQLIDGQKVVVVPEHGYEPFKSASQMRANVTRLRMALFWLERAEHVEQLGMVANLVNVELCPTKLAEISKEQSTVGAVARTVLSLTSEGDRDRLASASDKGVLGGVLSGLTDLIGVRTKTFSQASSEQPEMLRRRTI